MFSSKKVPHIIDGSSKNLIKVLKAKSGDCILIKFFGDDNNCHNIIVDTGFFLTFNSLEKELKKIIDNKQLIDLLIITHIDDDHIGGLKKFIQKYEDKITVEKYWFNDGEYRINNRHDDNKISFKQGILFSEYLKRINKQSDIIIKDHKLNLSGAKLTVFSPDIEVLNKFQKKWNNQYDTLRKNNKIASNSQKDWNQDIQEISNKVFKEDTRLENKVSIAFLFNINNKSVLFLGDSAPSDIIDYLIKKGFSETNRFRVDYIKLSHHASKANTNHDLISLIDCKNYLISTNGQNDYGFPHKETMAKILTNKARPKDAEGKYIEPIHLFFNYEDREYKGLFTAEDKENYNFRCHFAKEDQNGICIDI